MAACHHRGMIERAVRLSRATSSMTSAGLLVAFNLVPLVGVLLWGWNVATILVLYWVENGIVGLLNIPKMLLASGPAAPVGGPVDGRGYGSVVVGVSDATAKVLLVPFFLIHYGLFWVVHGVFVFLLPTFVGAAQPTFVGLGAGLTGYPLDRVVVGPDMTAVAWGAIGLAISRIASFLINYVGRGEYRRMSPLRQMFAPYGRLVILHLTILFGAFVSLAIGSPVGAILALVVVKTVADLGLHLREHAALEAAPAG
jgi:hypothetical protein